MGATGSDLASETVTMAYDTDRNGRGDNSGERILPMNNDVLHNSDSLYRPAIVANIGWTSVGWFVSNCASCHCHHFKWAKVDWAPTE
jgi:hypothetical protein